MAANMFQPSTGELRDRLLRDLRLGAIDAGLDEPPTQPGSDWFLLSTGMDSIGLLQFANLAAAEAANNVLDATGEDLDRIREAEGLPKVEPGKASGKIVVTILGSTTIPNGTPLTLENGLAATVVGNYPGPADQAEIDVQAVEPGSGANLRGGATVRFDAAPVNVATDAKVSQSFPLTGGTDGEDDARKRDRILNARRNRPAGGNWGQIRDWGQTAVPSNQDTYSYPALGGPGSAKAVPIRGFNYDTRDFSRTVTDAALQATRSFIQSKMPVPQEMVVQATADEALDVTLRVALPDSALSGGNGQGWADPSPWPPTPAQSVAITAVTSSNDGITVNAVTSTSPLAGLTRVAWWSSSDRSFQTRLVTAVDGSSGAWVLTLESPLLDGQGNGPAVGDYISPAAYNLDAYGLAWLKAIESFGPGENTDDANRLPRARRHPYTTDEDPTDVTNATIGTWAKHFPEISNYSLLYANETTPTVPTSTASPPNVFVPRRFAIYEF